MRKLYIDMDGVLALWEDYYIPIEEMTKKGFFLNLKPNENLIKAIQIIDEKYDDVDINILSVVFKDDNSEEKDIWLDKYLPCIPKEKRTYLPSGSNKADVFKDKEKDVYTLLDDYTSNLKSWREAGGRGIKVLNGENNISTKWTGDYIFYRTEPTVLAETIRALVLK